MSLYSYVAKTKQGETKIGNLEARDEHELAVILRKEGYLLIKSDIKQKRKFFLFRFSIRGVPLVEKIMLTRNLRIMIISGVSLPRSLDILIVQSKSKKLKKALSEIKEKVLEGESFSNSLSGYPNIFSEVFVNMVKVGEESGTLEKVLDVLGKQMERQHEINDKVKGAMIYPAVIIVAMTGIGILMLILVVPKLAALFEELGISLPLSTRIVIALGMFFSRFWYTVPFMAIILVLSFKALVKTKTGKLIFDTIALKIPLISPIVRKINSASTVRTLSSLISAGVPIVRSLEIVSNALGNIYYKKAMIDASERVRKGSKLAEVMKDYEDIYSTLVVQMVAVGEETGETSAILEKLADFFEEEVSNATRNLSSVVEPILMLIIGAMVGFFAISMVQPMYSMLGEIK
jgi:type IV pilus assembly protein PilC